jgi:hypothetical protein
MLTTPAGYSADGEHSADDRAVGKVVGDLRELRQCANARVGAPYQAKVERRDTEPSQGAELDRPPSWQRCRKYHGPAQRKAHVHNRSGEKQSAGAALASEQQRPRSERRLQHTLV